jgi:hypothetical protein
MNINIIIIIIINNRRFNTHTHASEFIISKTSWHTKTYGVTKKSWIVMKINDTLLPRGMPCHHHMVQVINRKRQQYFQLVNN